jgi:hypothetical protein
MTLVALLAVLVSCHLYLESDSGLLSDNYMLYLVKTRVLGNSLYGKTCDEASYQIAIPPYRPSDRNVEAVITPAPGREQECPAFIMIVDRTSGELWRID